MTKDIYESIKRIISKGDFAYYHSGDIYAVITDIKQLDKIYKKANQTK